MSNVLLGGAIGDALGKFAESKTADYAPLLAWNGIDFIASEHHNLAANCFTDDTQFSLEVAKSLIENNGFEPDDLAERYVKLFTSKTIRGYGRTTLAAVQNLYDGIHWSKSGVSGSCGNGTAMRAAPFGIYFRNDLPTLIDVCRIDSAITHASDEAEAGSIAIALATAYAINNDTEDLLEKIHDALPTSKVKEIIFSLGSLVDSPYILPSQALNVLGTRADVRMTIPAVLYTFVRFNDYHPGIECIIRGGGDCDTNGAILGALYGAKFGMKCFPSHMVNNIEDSLKLIELDSQLFNRSNAKFF